MHTLERVEAAAHILYAAYYNGGYSPKWSTATNKAKWREAANALLNAIEDGIV